MLFGLYYIPFETEFYDIGSKIIGYDIIKNKHLKCLKEVNKKWVNEIEKYGFHMTITDAVTVDKNSLPFIEGKIYEILNCFSKNLEFTLSLNEISYWPNNPTQLAIRLKSNNNVEMLHNVLVSIIQILGSDSLYLDDLNKQITEGKIRYTLDQIKKIKMFYSPYIFEQFKPHFTLLNPFYGDECDREKVKEFILSKFDKPINLSINKLIMVTKKDNDKFFKVHKIFNL
jgi:hypothetical protein